MSRHYDTRQSNVIGWLDAQPSKAKDFKRPTEPLTPPAKKRRNSQEEHANKRSKLSEPTPNAEDGHVIRGGPAPARLRKYGRKRSSTNPEVSKYLKMRQEGTSTQGVAKETQG